MTSFFKDGSINIKFDTLNWDIGTTIVATIQYGTGKYLGAKGFVELNVKEVEYDSCKKAWRWTNEGKFIFTN